MPAFYNFTENGLVYSFDNIFVPADLFRDGNLRTWGAPNNGRIGNAVIATIRSTPVTTFAGGNNWKQVDNRAGNTVSIKTDGTLWIWGTGLRGQLGNGATTGDISTPVTTFAGGTNWKQVSSGERHTVAIKTDGTLWTWGYGEAGRLGNAVTTNVSTPVTTFVGGTNWKQVSAKGRHTAAIKTDGTLWTWGSGGNGQIGNFSGTNRSTPVTTFAGGNNWKQVDTSNLNTAAIKTDGTLWIWGTNTSAQLGINDTIGSKNTPVTTFAGGTNWKQVSCGYKHTAAIKTDGTLWTWGSNITVGVLGINLTTNNMLTPVTTFAGGTNWKQVSCGYYHTSSIKTDGTLWLWGRSQYGELGNSSTTPNIFTPVTTFAGGTNWKQVSSAGYHTSAVTYDDPVI